MEALIETEAGLIEFGRCFSMLVGTSAQVNLRGELGAGKTTFVRGVLQGAGHREAVRSPTFSLVESYTLAAGKVFHFDLYRLQDPEELEYIGIRDYLHQDALCLVEWPEKAAGFLPDADLEIMIEITEKGRRVSLQFHTNRGQALLEKLESTGCLERYRTSG